MSFRSKPAAFRSCWIWLIISRAIPAEIMASSCVVSNATTIEPSADPVDSHCSPSFEKLIFETNSVTASSSMSSTTSLPDSRHATASSWDIFRTAVLTAFIFFPSFFPRTGKLGFRERVTQSCSSSLGTTTKSQALSSERMYFFSGPMMPSTTCGAGLRRMATTDLTGVRRLMFRFSRAFRPCSTMDCNASIASTAEWFSLDSSYLGRCKKWTESLFPGITGLVLPPPLAASAYDGWSFRRCW
mmetsp:Transcript_42556/g.102572  ORF Transcript_42556/g.102572 Transcript_42556/m.102572 type:complete len:243 (+) Transcript_42556:552-1280(+)